jgi:hypothetical protein
VYNAIFFFEMFTLGQALSPAVAAADARSAPTQQMCSHYERLLSPSGAIASFGDSWSFSGVNQSSWLGAEAFWWPAVFERCATAAQEAGDAAGASALAFAAASNFFVATGAWQSPSAAQCSPEQPAPQAGALTPSGPPDARDLRMLLLADFWAGQQAPRAAAVQAPFSTQLLSRRKQPVGDLAPDKLVLTPDRASGALAPYAEAELWHASVLYHTHIEQVGSLPTYAAGGTTFLRHAGRDNPLPDFSSTLMVWRDPANASSFPFRGPEQFLHPGQWSLAELPTTHMSPFPSMAPSDFFQRNLSHLHFFVSNELPAEHLQLSLAYLTLFNPSTGAELVLDDFVAVDYVWPNASIAVEPGAPGPSKAVLTIDCAPGLSNNTRPASVKAPLDLVFDARDWQLLRFYWRLSPNAPRNSSAILTVTTGPYTIPEGDYAAQPVIGSCYDWGSVGVGAGTPCELECLSVCV